MAIAALDDQLLLAVTTSVASATFLVGFLGNQFHRTLDFARTAAARDDDEALGAPPSSLPVILQRQEHRFEQARKGLPVDWMWLAVIAAIAVVATLLAVAAAAVPEEPVSNSGLWTVAVLVALTWLIVSAAAWDWYRTARELLRVRRSTYVSAIVELREHLAAWKSALDETGNASGTTAGEEGAIRHRVGAVQVASPLIAKLPRSSESPLAAVARGWSACALIARADDIVHDRMTDEETRVSAHGGTAAPTIAADLAGEALADLWESVRVLAEATPPALLTASAWAVETARSLNPPPPCPEPMPAEWDAWCLLEAARRRRRHPTVRLDPAPNSPADPIGPSWRVYDGALRLISNNASQSERVSDELYSALRLLDELVRQVDALPTDETRTEAQSAAIAHIRALIPKVIASGPSGVSAARAYLWKWPFLTTSSPAGLSGSWLEPTARELRDKYLDVAGGTKPNAGADS